MAILDNTYDQLTNKGIVTFDDLQDFGKNELKKVTNNLQNPALIPMLIKVVRF